MYMTPDMSTSNSLSVSARLASICTVVGGAERAAMPVSLLRRTMCARWKVRVTVSAAEARALAGRRQRVAPALGEKVRSLPDDEEGAVLAPLDGRRQGEARQEQQAEDAVDECVRSGQRASWRLGSGRGPVARRGRRRRARGRRARGGR